MHNTAINYLYRDADNYKIANRAVVKGEMTPAQWDVIKSCLDAGEYFIPSLLGLPETRFSRWDESVDHIWFEMEGCEQARPDEMPEDIDVEQLVERFMFCKGQWEQLNFQVESGVPLAWNKIQENP